MVNSFCRAEDFQQIENKRENVNIVRFSKEPILTPVLDDEGKPTGEYEDSGLVSYTEEVVVGELTLEKVIAVRRQEIEVYDKSDAVNSLSVNGKQMWFDKVTRTCISYSMNTEKAAGQETTELYDNDDMKYTLPIDLAIQMFGALELYAKACYNKTEEHKAAVAECQSIEDALDYNIKTGYPQKLSFDIPLVEESE